MNLKINWPSGKAFAFTIFDDPDFDTIETTTSLYSFLKDLGFRTDQPGVFVPPHLLVFS
jgi:hypothetical protein